MAETIKIEAPLDVTGAIRSGGVAVPTISSVSTLTNKTFTSPTLTAPALGAATATSVAATTFFSTGTIPATTGELRLSNSTGIIDARNAANSGNLRALRLTSGDVFEVGDNSAGLLLKGSTITTAAGYLSSSATAGLGYTTGAGGTIGQASSKSTGVTLDKVTGLITMNNASLDTLAIVSFTLTSAAIAATDVLILNHVSGGTVGAYAFQAQPAAGSAVINVMNNTAGALGEAVVIRYLVIKGVSA